MKYELKDHSHCWQAIEHYGDYDLSIIAGSACYSIPREKLPSIEQYQAVEIAIRNANTESFVSIEFLTQFLPMFYDDVVQGYASWDEVNIVRKRLELLANGNS